MAPMCQGRIETQIDDQHAIAHNKMMIIDNATIITGSFNFTKAAEERNAENLLVLKDAPDLVILYKELPVGHIFCFRGTGAMMGMDAPP